MSIEIRTIGKKIRLALTTMPKPNTNKKKQIQYISHKDKSLWW